MPTPSPRAFLAKHESLALTALLCHLWRAMTGSRTAMAAAIIIMWHPPGAHLWDAALSRLVAVFLGCLLGLVITLIFHRKLPGARSSADDRVRIAWVGASHRDARHRLANRPGRLGETPLPNDLPYRG